MNVNRKELLAALTQAARVADPKAHRTALRNVLLETGGPILYVKSTDLETYFSTYIDGEGGPDRGFRVLVNAKNARDLVKNLTGETVEVVDLPGSLDLNIGSGLLRGEDSDLLPNLPDAPGEPTFSVNGPDFKRMISEVAYAASREGSRYAFSGIMIERKDNGLRLVATDGRRLATTVLSYMGGPEFQAVVPVKLLGYVRMALGKLDLVTATVGTNYVQFVWGRSLMTVRQLESRFPEYSAVIPKSGSLPNRVWIDRVPLIAALKSLKPFTSGDVSVVRFEADDNKLTLSAKDSSGEGSVTLDANVHLSGATALNPQYLLEALKASNLPEVRMEFSDDCTPVLWNMGFTYVQMPISGTA